MSELTLILSSTLRKYIEGYDPYTGHTMEFPLPATVRDVVAYFGIPHEGVHIIMVNNAHGTLDTPLTEKTRLALFPAVGGG